MGWLYGLGVLHVNHRVAFGEVRIDGGTFRDTDDYFDNSCRCGNSHNVWRNGAD